MYTIEKTFSFSAAHSLPYLEDGHPCKRLHGHNYKARLVLAKEFLDEKKFVLDYRSLDKMKEWIDSTLDHRNLNEVLDVPTTAECIAEAIFWKARELFGSIIQSASVSETEKTWATFNL